MADARDTAAKPPSEPETSERRSTSREYLEALIIAALFLAFANTFVVQSFYIPSGSMENTLLVGDHLFVNRFLFGPAPHGEAAVIPLRDIRRGDIVIFRSPENPKNVLVKRCVALAGDTVEVVRKQLYINGKQVDDGAYVIHKDPETYPNNPFLQPGRRLRDTFGPYQVPAGHIFCMGDNRDQSYDSRFWGPVPRHLVQGRAEIIYWSFGGETPDGNWHGWGQKLRQLGNTALGFFTKTRWTRTFQLIR
jgi:signal peptidase I